LERLSVIDPNKVGLVITDIEMPETDGYQVAQAIKDNVKLANIPVVVNSSMTTTAVRHKMELIGVDDFVGKTDLKSLYNSVIEFVGDR
jgi:two-component system chemotaxis response regulator CheV